MIGQETFDRVGEECFYEVMKKKWKKPAGD
jgi:hypothetical protein